MLRRWCFEFIHMENSSFEVHAAMRDVFSRRPVDAAVGHAGGEVPAPSCRMRHAPGARHVTGLLRRGLLKLRIGGKRRQPLRGSDPVDVTGALCGRAAGLAEIPAHLTGAKQQHEPEHGRARDKEMHGPSLRHVLILGRFTLKE